MNIKFIILLILSLIMGIVFFVAGFYFLSKKYIIKLNEATPDKSPEKLKKNEIRSKGCGYVAFGVGGITLTWAFLMFLMPSAIYLLALIYMIFLIIAFIFISYVFR